jgi:nuclear pore complex protein Nup160
MDEVYWVKIMRLYEGVESSEGVVRIALYGVTECCHDDEVSSLMWSNIFKHSLIIKDHTLSYHSILNNPDQIKAKECLRHFITILVEWEWFDVICQYMYHMYEEEVESVLLAMARSSDPFTSPYYDILYSFHMERSNYWKGAQVKYEHGYRAGNERPDFDGITQQCNCYVVSWSLLNIVDNKHQWIISPSDSKMKIITKSELDKECHLLKAKLSLMEINQSLSHHLCGIHVKVKEVIMLLTQSGMIDRAIRLSNVYRMSCVPIMEEVTARCISLSSNVFQQM